MPPLCLKLIDFRGDMVEEFLNYEVAAQAICTVLKQSIPID